jgi:hypothetical protein
MNNQKFNNRFEASVQIWQLQASYLKSNNSARPEWQCVTLQGKQVRLIIDNDYNGQLAKCIPFHGGYFHFLYIFFTLKQTR